MKAKIKESLRNLGRTIGLEVRMSSPNSRDDLRLLHFMEMMRINTVLDVGANDGGFARMLLATGYKGRVISFEPIPRAHSELVEASKGSKNWSVAPRLALSDENGEANFNITQGDTSSSLLEPLESFVSDTPHVKVSEVVQVPTRRLDDLEDIDFDPARTLLKLDVQGGEAKVLSGANRMLQSTAGILTEMSLMPLYEGQPEWRTVDRIITEHGFEIWDIWPGYRSPNTRRLTQIDGLYFKPERSH